jgi:DNA-binding transcriptional LysR family regulator
MGRRLDALEERLGVKLLVRTTRRITLTHEGSAFLEDCQRLLADIANAEASVSAGGVKASGHLRITAPAGFGRRHVAPLVPRFREQHKDVTISLNLSDRVVDLAGEGFDCAVRVGDLPDSSLVSVRLADNRRLCVATPEYLRARHAGASERPGALRLPDAVQRRLADARLGVPRAAHCRPGARTAPRRARGMSTSSPAARSTAPTARCCTTGACRATASPGAAPGRWSRRSPTGRLVEVLAAFAAPPNGIYAVFPQRKHLPLRVRLWIDFLKHHYAQPQFWMAGATMILESLLPTCTCWPS